MAMYWRCDDIPELHGVLKAQRRRLWSEAVTRSFSVRNLLAHVVVVIFGGALLGAWGYSIWPAFQAWLPLAICGMTLGGVFADYSLKQPRARRWLREHAGELDRYISA